MTAELATGVVRLAVQHENIVTIDVPHAFTSQIHRIGSNPTPPALIERVRDPAHRRRTMLHRPLAAETGCWSAGFDTSGHCPTGASKQAGMRARIVGYAGDRQAREISGHGRRGDASLRAEIRFCTVAMTGISACPSRPQNAPSGTSAQRGTDAERTCKRTKSQAAARVCEWPPDNAHWWPTDPSSR